MRVFPRNKREIHCGSGLGHPRRFEHPLATSAFPLKATESLHCGGRRGGPQAELAHDWFSSIFSGWAADIITRVDGST